MSACVPAQAITDLAAIRALVVDDDEFILDITLELLRQSGVGFAQGATDGQSALDLIDVANHPWQLLICDLTMPRMDGITFLRHLAHRKFAGGVLLVTGANKRLADTVGYLAKELKLRLLGVEQKPLSESALDQAIRALSIASEPDHSPERLHMLSPSDISAGLASGQCLEPWFQPKFSIQRKCVVGAECLARWRNANGDLIPPLAFIPVAEKHGLIDQLTLAIFRQSTTILREWIAQGHNFKVAVNISMHSLTRTKLDLPDHFSEIVRQSGIEPSAITLEVTEGSLMREVDAALEILTRLRLKGFNLAIDDFGMGYSNLATLKLLPFTELKVDRSFVYGAANDSVKRAILESSVRLGKALDMRVVAEGVETQSDWDAASEARCDEVQGYFIDKPLPARDFLARKNAWNARWGDVRGSV